MDPSIRATDVIMIVAAFAGPIVAVQVQSFLERRRGRRERQLKVFRTLMATRARKAADPSHVEALNLISIEFYRHKPVIGAWNLYIDHLNSVGPTPEAWADKMSDLFADLMYRMALALRFEFDKVQIKRQSYSPVLHADLETDSSRSGAGYSAFFRGISQFRFKRAASHS